MSRPHDGPRISVVTPSFNQGCFLGGCFRSVLSQGYPNLEYIVIDGGSTDGSVEIIKDIEKELAYWVSEPDDGHYDAVNKGFRHATGDILAWLNSDDMYTPWAFAVVAEIFQAFPQVEWISTVYPLYWNASNLAVDCQWLRGFRPASVLRRGLGVQQESTFWRRTLWERVGGRLDTSFALAADLELWARFWRHASELYGVAVPLAGFRTHADQRSVRLRDGYMAEAALVRERYADLVQPTGSMSRAVRLGQDLYRSLPHPVRRLLGRCGVPYHWGTHPASVIRQRAGRWCIDHVGVW